jgi:hypothetical protein
MAETKRYNVRRKDKTVEFRMPMEDYKKFEEEVKNRKDKNISATLRMLVEKYMAKEIV